MPVLRVFLCTHRRPQLLRRALGSLLRQTFTDWVCELHNDAPDDDEPRAILNELAPGDARFIYRPHERNLGPVATFNLTFTGGPEPYASLLEDDNWWEPRLLEVLVQALENRPDASLAWANMRIWEEYRDGTWHDTGRNIWEVDPGAPAIALFHAPELLQAVDALHSNGATVFRPERFRTRTVPSTLPFAVIEQARERTALGPMLLVSQPLANFARTWQTVRTADPTHWLQAKLLVAASVFARADPEADDLRRLWAVRREIRPRDTALFFQVAIVLRRPRTVAPANAGDWLHFFAHAVRRPVRLVRGLRFRRAHAEAWDWLCQQTSFWPRSISASVVQKRVPASAIDGGQTASATAVRAEVGQKGAAAVLVIVPTFRRAHLLPRALRSLQAQTLRDWVAEIHNDDPADPRPAAVVAAFGDPRLKFVQHPERLGAPRTFNLAFQTHPEPYCALLEDDNWWHPEFLSTMVAALDSHPGVTVAWSNQEIWKETPDGHWHPTGRCVRPGDPGAAPVLCHWPHPIQCFGALHSNGSMLIRSNGAGRYPTPEMKLGGTEAVRERCLPHPLLYVPKPLGVFAVTLETSRSRRAIDWASNQVLLAASFMRHADLRPAQWARLWCEARRARPRMTDTLLLASFQLPELAVHRRYANRTDWCHLAWRTILRPNDFIPLLHARSRRMVLWEYLDTHSAARNREAKAHPFAQAPMAF